MNRFPFELNGRTVIGIKDMTKWQYWFTYGFIWAWIVTVAYIIILSAVCPVMWNGEVLLSCPYLTDLTKMPAIMASIFAMAWTYFVRKQVNRRNYKYEGEEEV